MQVEVIGVAFRTDSSVEPPCALLWISTANSKGLPRAAAFLLCMRLTVTVLSLHISPQCALRYQLQMAAAPSLLLWASQRQYLASFDPDAWFCSHLLLIIAQKHNSWGKRSLL